MRPRQWLKNLSLYAPLVFWGELFRPDGFVKVTKAAILFSMVSSAVYLVNDVVDAPRDRRHPFKKNRPIAAGELSVKMALSVAAALLTVGIVGSFSGVLFLLPRLGLFSLAGLL